MTSVDTVSRVPALGLRLVILLVFSIILMVLDHRQNHLGAVRQAIGAAVYPLQVIVDSPFRLWAWIREGTTDRNELQLENARLRTEVLITRGRIQELAALKAENDRLRAMLAAWR